MKKWKASCFENGDLAGLKVSLAFPAEDQLISNSSSNTMLSFERATKPQARVVANC